jgi:hypothetical protein
MSTRLVLLLSFWILCVPLLVSGQESLVPLPNNDQIFGRRNQLQRAQLRSSMLVLPFIDDFNQSAPFPDPALWEDDFVFINNTFPIDPPSLGVATFDGLNPLGQPYSLNPAAVGRADILSSRPIDLSGLSIQDNVYLSFYWQNGGRGDLPEPATDFFFLEFQNSDGEWVEVFRAVTPANISAFNQEFIQLTEPYFYDTFRFRFGAVGNLSGSVDHWHLDYVKLDKNRNPFTERSVPDLAFVSGPMRYFKDYFQLPYRHFSRALLADSLKARVKNNFLNTVDIVDNFLAVEFGSGDVLDSYSGPSEDVLSLATFDFIYDTLNIPEGLSEDTVVIDVTYFFNTSAESNSPDYVRANNILRRRIIFSNTFAYDDGSAERAYRLENADFNQVALGFRATVPDTLRAISLHLPSFPNFSPGLSIQPLFNIVVWSDIDTIGGDGGTELYRENLLRKDELVKPLGAQINDFGFYTFKPELNEGRDYLLVNGNFFIGIEYERGNIVDIGFDLNTVANHHLFFNIGRGWFRSEFPGALMINAIMGGKLSGIYTSVKETNTQLMKLKVYPSPVEDRLNILPEALGAYDYALYDISGKQQMTGRGEGLCTLELSNLQPGLYILVIDDVAGQWRGHTKILKQ